LFLLSALARRLEVLVWEALHQEAVRLYLEEPRWVLWLALFHLQEIAEVYR
jgi:hypothetical protein